MTRNTYFVYVRCGECLHYGHVFIYNFTQMHVRTDIDIFTRVWRHIQTYAYRITLSGGAYLSKMSSMRVRRIFFSAFSALESMDTRACGHKRTERRTASHPSSANNIP